MSATVTQTHTTTQYAQVPQHPPHPPPAYTVTTNVANPQPVVVQPGVAHNTVVVQSVPTFFGKQPANVICTNCHQNIVTRTTSSLKGEAWVLAAVLCFLGGILCVWIPFVMDSMYVTTHHCPSCNAFQGASR
uniref:Lipopolysaccharide-induced tumor necrosis factor-alpha factor homolog n=1 Tax=Phallusia mammillata TaxID=59560 RepID=A0A6F9DKL2_9ASCI|nr:lipopolysaccharide-induced tumor necrosis factor-alpha factor homolog [Phallusia mammillata]